MERINDKLLSWASILEEGTRRQAEATSERPFIHPHVALMPDAHLGKGATVGSVIPTEGAVMPAAVGVDIGCGMMAVRTQFTADEVVARRGDGRGDGLGPLHAGIARRVPLSAGKYNRSLSPTAGRRLRALRELARAAKFNPASYAENWEQQLGSLGSGNHFIEVTVDEQDRVWLFLHTGSRGVGNKIAQKHIAVARDECASLALPDRDLAHLSEGTDSFAAYIREMRWAQEFARLNREEIMDRTADALTAWMDTEVERVETINCHHNYTTRERHFGRKVWLTRKGAIDAAQGARGLIPGSMGTASYVVTGKGNPLSLNSSPHGAGRNFSRTAARKRFSRQSLDEAMRGVAWGRSDAFLDEHPEAYKDIDVVMADAADLVTVDHTLRQIVNVKGD
ncbi:RtcB family protein [Pseudonocardia bannensis]|uniref:3'-phosphate/5'-hydroxy nucleic acid ligase n=1 Tax=Pseudonocardia bannensis TaxID=630973 RepID=A0A848DIE6_9PSEU|nr:RtcB family protein [Pseudonocardia bannensis]NMH92468.1 RtcB family protein [Pseudonocardia bannensis]